MLGVHLSDCFVRAASVVGDQVAQAHVESFDRASARPDQIIDAIVAAARGVDPAPGAVGLAIPGELDRDGRCWGLSGIAGFDGVYIGEELSARLDCPVALDSEGASAALAESVHGRGTHYDSFLMVLLGASVVGGLVLGGKVLVGASGFVAELAHLRIDSSPEAVRCICGRTGCLGALIGDTFADSADAPTAAQIRDAADWLGTAIAQVQNMLDLSAVIVAGPSVELFRKLEPGLREAARARVYGAPAAEVPIVPSTLGADAVLIGAAELARAIRKIG